MASWLSLLGQAAFPTRDWARKHGRAVLEICCSSAVDVRGAVIGGADRVELCTHLEAGGVSPSIGEVCATEKRKED